uniref:hypothetical protein n=1 Tax=Clostridium sp. NkU-1 TaxID=1095009 RepID=UPI003261C989
MHQVSWFYLPELVLCATVDIENSFYYKSGELPDYRAFKTVESKNRYQKGVIFFYGLSHNPSDV